MECRTDLHIGHCSGMAALASIALWHTAYFCGPWLAVFLRRCLVEVAADDEDAAALAGGLSGVGIFSRE